jgi:hypothetical protein
MKMGLAPSTLEGVIVSLDEKNEGEGGIFVFFENAKKKMKIFFVFFSKKFSSRKSGGRGFLRLTLVLQF